MGAAEVGDIAKVRVSYLAKRRNFPGVIGAHLYNGDIGIGSKAQERQWYSYVVVEVAFCLERTEGLV